ncbi:MAG: kelch repeat-containing protein [Gemmatales bacterium]|nr:hypothetical protein [Gemmatales bacterium]MDW7994432.1 kelch repeat-containing protein [Gemmatales bacterium]
MRLLAIGTLVLMLGWGVNGTASQADEGQLQELPPLPRGISSFGAAALGEHIYVFGGHSGRAHHYHRGNVHGELYRLNWRRAGAWEQLRSDVPGQGLALVAARGSLYRIGGMQPLNAEGEATRLQSLRYFARFDIAASKWERLPDLPEPRSSFDATVLGDHIYVFGGWDLGEEGARWHEHGLCFDLARPEQGWQRVPQPFQRRALTVVAYQEQIYVLGGLTPDKQVSLDVDIYDPQQKRWTKGPSLPGPRSNGFGCASGVADGKLYVSLSDGHLYELRGERWQAVGQIKPARAMHRLVALDGGSLCFIGGSPRQEGKQDTGEMLRLVQAWRVPR